MGAGAVEAKEEGGGMKRALLWPVYILLWPLMMLIRGIVWVAFELEKMEG